MLPWLLGSLTFCRVCGSGCGPEEPPEGRALAHDQPVPDLGCHALQGPHPQLPLPLRGSCVRSGEESPATARAGENGMLDMMVCSVHYLECKPNSCDVHYLEIWVCSVRKLSATVLWCVIMET